MSTNSTAAWRCGPTATYASASNSNGGGYDPGIASPGTDFSAPANITNGGPHVTFNGTTITAITSGVSTTITITGYTVASTDVANTLNISAGTNFTAGTYFIVSVNVGLGTWTLDKNCTSGVGAAMVGCMGGMLADFWTNICLGTASAVVALNTFYVLGNTAAGSTGTPDYTNNALHTPNYGTPLPTLSNGPVHFIGIGNLIYIKDNNGLIFNNQFDNTIALFENIYYFCGASPTFTQFGLQRSEGMFKNCKLDQFGVNITLAGSTKGMAGNEVFSSLAKSATTSSGPVLCNLDGSVPIFIGNNFHDLSGTAITETTGRGGAIIIDNIIINCTGWGIVENGRGALNAIASNTIDTCGLGGIEIIYDNGASQQPAYTPIYNNIFSNMPSGKYGIVGATGTALQFQQMVTFSDYNSYYNNAGGNVSNYPTGTHDVTLGGDPYVAHSTQNYQLTPAATFRGTAFPTSWLQSGAGNVSPTSNIVPGAVTPAGPPTSVYRKTLSPLGTRTGSRQMRA